MKYYDWIGETHECPECGWRGLGTASSMDEVFDDAAECLCPKCGHSFCFAVYPTADEMLTDPRASDADRQLAGIRATMLDNFERAKLKTPSQLPDLDPIPEVLYWDMPAKEGEQEFISIHDGNREVWREPAWYQCYERFEEIVPILREKYGPALRDLVPTARSELYLYGDSLSASDRVAKVRQTLHLAK